MTNVSRPAIPSIIKREVRQRCGFGCVICGEPIYHYDHIPGYAYVKRHRAEELTLLCAKHHDAKTRNILPNAEVIEANKNPYNILNKTSSPYAVFTKHFSPKIILGEQNFIWSSDKRPSCIIPILIHSYAPISFTLDTHGTLLNIDARNSRGQRILHIENSEILINTYSWDITFTGGRLKIWENHSNLALEMSFQNSEISIGKYICHINGLIVNINNKIIELIHDNKPILNLTGDGTVDANVGIFIGNAPPNLSIGIHYPFNDGLAIKENYIKNVDFLPYSLL